MMMNHRVHNDRGSLLLEALLAVVILSVSLVVIIQSMGTSARASAYTVYYTRALMLLEHRLFEALRNPAKSMSGYTTGSFEQPNEEFQYTAQSRPINQSGVKHLKEAEFHVTWQSQGREQQLGLTTYLLEIPEE